MSNAKSPSIRYIDSHTEGEPTRVIIAGGPELGTGPLAERVKLFREKHDEFRRTAILEPRGSDALVGALLVEPTLPECVAGVIFFNNEDYLGMCGHGAIGVAITLAYLGRIHTGTHLLETPVGTVSVDLLSPNEVTIENVPSDLYRQDVQIDVPDVGVITGDVAWGGNWFFLAHQSPATLNLSNLKRLTEAGIKIRDALAAAGVTGRDNGYIDHIEFFTDSPNPDADSRNFVLCPGSAYDRSPCGTGTSAKIACLAARGKLASGQNWIQESIIGSRFTASYRLNAANEIIPRITGRAFICNEGTLVQQAGDPFAHGITPE
ncbi:proline racemase family protein [Planctomicrobium sp. SH668]|uniref:4-hydroxyproline epimerase n=1 Tax=Planctomicrobium sp. SH668 TaxID=3448126 RepID=UPI003F5C0D44